MREREGGLAGLSEAEVAERVAAGRTNANTDVRTKPTGEIVAEHTLTLFNGVNLALALLVILAGEPKNLFFMVVVAANLLIGVVQELRAKRTVDKLTILTQQEVTVVRAEGERSLDPHDLVLDDLVRLSHGDQVPADAVIVSGYVSVDESLLTGEAKPVSKGPGDELLSGSFLDAGSLVCRVNRVGAEGYAARINAEAKYVKPVASEILETLQAIIKLASVALVPLGLGLFLRTLLMDAATVEDAILAAVAAVLGMIPQGLMLLTSSILAIATTRLGRRNVLVQQLYCVEALARVDTLCLDKTGTITTGEMEVSSIVPAVGVDEADAECALVSISTANREDANDTDRALLCYAAERGVRALSARRRVAFCSARKYSGCVCEDGRALVMGAASFVLGAERAHEADALARAFDATERVLVVGEVPGLSADGGLEGDVRLLGCVAIRDQIRDTAAETMRYFREQGVELRVISGDDPRTVSAIAARVGVPDAERFVDATTLGTPEALAEAARTCRVFGRVTPQQKRDLVRALHEHGRTVAMTGDGVNDVLALREADCSVCLASGSAAARNVSEIVLVDNDFAHMPEVVAEGRRSINNLQRSAVLFLVKTVFTAALALICIIMPPYPFLPIQMSLISVAIIGLPSFVLALEPNHERVRGGFLANVLARSLPASAAIVCGLFVELVCARALGYSFEEISTVGTILVTAVGVVLIWRISQPLTPLRVLLLAVVIGIVAGGCILHAPFFEIAHLRTNMVVVSLAAGAPAVAFFNWLYDRSLASYETDERFTRLVSRLEGTHDHRRNRGL
ncbi:HAD-IC family P-type ATPase [Thermophilibacter immobilis]|jgi:cation-transporting ATPase E|uniref:HAD-IC family P-type ATPase n=1 Tax=Thermophilibacter immobilis TaxID=2779519 RepID=A0A7S7RTZ8_9ACTN|nr:HAD-IC family P-type ATPase [Thermophilibacter immobilis]QOY59897.1 HAD-IC family P-type ATPase [Thermophilibacter immobilis]